MARLNEAPVPTESIDALKRRFIKQNRELAKNNSTQSVRIRALEAETSRLVAENLSLRERIVQLQTEIDNNQGRYAAERVNTVKDRLEAKIQELGGLVAELGLLQKPKGRRKSHSKGSPKQSPGQRNWRNGLAMSDAVAEQGGRLPTITEGKHYPRRTLESEEIRGLLADAASESPDLGPPPVAHFQDEDPIKFDPGPAPNTGPPDGVSDVTDALPAALSVNLETRRKRKDSKLEIRRMSVFQSPPERPESASRSSESEQALPLRLGAKRKLSTRDDDPRTVEDFRFNRKTTAGADGEDNVRLAQVIEAEKAAARADESDDRTREKVDDNVPPSSPRKALADKSVNSSPKKSSKPFSSDSKPDFKKPMLPANEGNRSRIRPQKTRNKDTPALADPINIPKPTLPASDTVEIAEILPDPATLPPKTPAGLDLFSPTSTQASTGRPESNDTPPPGDLLPPALAGDETNAVGRVARRARTAVNYAEPNLVSKMRRPTKELVDAVGKEGKRSASREELVVLGSAPANSTSSSGTEKSKMRTVVIKREKEDGQNDAWKNLPIAPERAQHDDGALGEPNSPLSNKSSIISRDERTSTENREAVEAAYDPASSTALSTAAMSNSTGLRKKSAKPSESLPTPPLDDNITVKRDSLAIFDFTESSPPEPKTNLDSAKASREDLARMRAARRHSSVSSLANTAAPSAAGSTTASTTVRATDGIKVGDELSRSKSTKDSRPGRTMAGAEASSKTGVLAGRSERAAARRKSMMI